MLKICPEKIAAPLQIILNAYLLQCNYPTSWKIAHVWCTVEYFGRKLD
jgi:hypothetical protein